MDREEGQKKSQDKSKAGTATRARWNNGKWIMGLHGEWIKWFEPGGVVGVWCRWYFEFSAVFGGVVAWSGVWVGVE